MSSSSISASRGTRPCASTDHGETTETPAFAFEDELLTAAPFVDALLVDDSLGDDTLGDDTLGDAPLDDDTFGDDPLDDDPPFVAFFVDAPSH